MSITITQNDFSGGMKGRLGQFTRPSKDSFKDAQNLIPDSSGGLVSRPAGVELPVNILPTDRAVSFERNGEVYHFVYDPLLKFQIDIPQTFGDNPHRYVPGTWGGDFTDAVPTIKEQLAGTKDFLGAFNARFLHLDSTSVDRTNPPTYVDAFGAVTYEMIEDLYTSGDSLALSEAASRTGLSNMPRVRPMRINLEKFSYWWNRTILYNSEGRVVTKSVIRPFILPEDTGEEEKQVVGAAGDRQFFYDFLGDAGDTFFLRGGRESSYELRNMFFGPSPEENVYEASVGVDHVVFYSPGGKLPPLIYDFNLNVLIDLRCIYGGNPLITHDTPVEPIRPDVEIPSVLLVSNTVQGLGADTPSPPEDSLYGLLNVTSGNSPGVPGKEFEGDIGREGSVVQMPAALWRNQRNFPDYIAGSGVDVRREFFGSDRKDVPVTFNIRYNTENHVSVSYPRTRPMYTNTQSVAGSPLYSGMVGFMKKTEGTQFGDVYHIEFAGNPVCFIRGIPGNIAQIRYLPFLPPIASIGFITFTFPLGVGQYNQINQYGDQTTDKGAREIPTYYTTYTNDDEPYTDDTIHRDRTRYCYEGQYKDNYYNSAAFVGGRFILGGSVESSNVLEATNNVIDPNATTVLDFNPYIRAQVSPDIPATNLGFRQPLVPEGGLRIWWVGNIRGRLYIGTSRGIISTVDALSATLLTSLKLERGIIVPSFPVDALNYFFYVGVNKKKIYALDFSRDLQRETINSVSDSIYMDWLQQNTILGIYASQGEDFIILRVKEYPKDLFYGHIRADGNLAFIRLSFKDRVNILSCSVTNDLIHAVLEGGAIISLDVKNFGGVIEEDAHVTLDILSPSIIALNAHQDRVLKELMQHPVVNGTLVGEFPGGVEISSEYRDGQDEVKPITDSMHQVNFVGVAREELYDSVRFRFIGRHTRIVSVKYGIGG